MKKRIDEKLQNDQVAQKYDGARTIEAPQQGDPELGPLQLLPGTWENTGEFAERGWNLIALPFFEPGSPRDFRLLLNRYNEKLTFQLVDKGVPNRGLARFGATTTNLDQLLVTLDYEQVITQTDAVDSPVSGKVGQNGFGIHHEPGLWLYHLNEISTGLNVARLGTIPHGDAVLALGTSDQFKGFPVVPDVSPLPIGVTQAPTNGYLKPYFEFTGDNKFAKLFDPSEPVELLRLTNANLAADTDIVSVTTTQLHVNTSFGTGGIVNIPFIVAQANAGNLESFFWIMDIQRKGGKRQLLLQYLQIVMLDFFPRRDGLPGLIRWPHVSINTMEKTAVP